MVGQLDHRARPAAPASSERSSLRAGFEQAVAMRRASSLLASLRSAPASRLLVQGGFEITFNEAALGPVNGPMPPTATAAAISSSLSPLSAASRIWARLILRA